MNSGKIKFEFVPRHKRLIPGNMEPMKPTTSSVKFVIEQKFNKTGLMLTLSLHDMGLEVRDLQPLQILLKNTFGKLIEVTLRDSIYSIYDKLIRL